MNLLKQYVMTCKIMNIILASLLNPYYLINSLLDIKEVNKITNFDLIISILGFPFYVCCISAVTILNLLLTITLKTLLFLDKEIKFKR